MCDCMSTCVKSISALGRYEEGLVFGRVQLAQSRQNVWMHPLCALVQQSLLHTIPYMHIIMYIHMLDTVPVYICGEAICNTLIGHIYKGGGKLCNIKSALTLTLTLSLVHTAHTLNPQPLYVPWPGTVLAWDVIVKHYVCISIYAGEHIPNVVSQFKVYIYV